MDESSIPDLSPDEARKAKKRAHDREYHAKNRAKRLAYNKLYYADHRAKICQQNGDYYHANKPTVLAKRRETATTEESKAARHAYNVAYRAANHARLLARERDYAKSPRGQAVRKEAHRRRKARKHNAPINDFTDAQFLALCMAAGYRCCYCRKKFVVEDLTPDHLTPYAKQGSNTLHNVLPCCLDCNMRKKDRAVLKPVQPFLLLSDEDAAD